MDKEERRKEGEAARQRKLSRQAKPYHRWSDRDKGEFSAKINGQLKIIALVTIISIITAFLAPFFF